MDQNKNKFFSFILCVNQHQHYLKECVDSLILQDFNSKFNILVCINGDHQKLREFFSQYQNHIDKGILTIYETRIQNLSFNLNYLSAHSDAQYLVRMDADDVSEPNRLSVLYSEIRKNEFPDIIFSNVIYIDENSNIKSTSKFPTDAKKAFWFLPFKNIINHPSVAMRREFLYDIGGYLGGFKSEDYDLWLRSRRFGAKIFLTQKYLLKYRYHSGQSTKNFLTYAEILSYWVREFLLEISLYNCVGLLVSFSKAVVVKLRRIFQ